MMSRFGIIILLCCILLFPLQIQTQTTHTFPARVVDSFTHAPLDSARVTLLNGAAPVDTSFTDSNGIAVLHLFISSVAEQPANIPASFYIEQNYPNPVAEQTQVRFGVRDSGELTFRLVNVLGQQVAAGRQYLSAGNHLLHIDG